MPHEINGPGEKITDKLINRSALVMGAVLVGGLVEVGRSVSRHDKEDITGVESYRNDQGPSFIFMRGCGENYQVQAPIVAEMVQQYGSLHFPYQTQGKHSQEIIDQGIIEACERDGNRDRVIIATSMGLMNTMRSLMNPEVTSAIGSNNLKAIVSRSGMTSRSDLQPAMQRAAGISSKVPNLAVIGDGWRMHRLHRARGDIKHSTSTTDDQVRKQYESSARMPFPLVASQYRTIHNSQPFQDGSLVHITQQHPDLELYQISADYDGVVNRQSAALAMESAFHLPVDIDIDTRLHHGAHAEDIAYIEPLAARMAELSTRHTRMMTATINLSLYSDHQFALAS